MTEPAISPTAATAALPPSSGRSRPADLRALTSLRFFAALVVFIHHIVNNVLFTTATAASNEAAYPFHTQILRQGHIGVTFFFVLSGFVLTHVYDRVFTRFDLRTVGRFYVARIARIYPLHLLTFLLFIPAALTGTGFAKPVLAVGAVANLLLLQAWIPLGGNDGVVVSYNSVSWTLSVEAFFYLMFPLALYLIARLGRKHLHAIGVALCIWWLAIVVCTNFFPASPDVNWFFSNFPARRLIDFVVGIWLYMMMVRGGREVRPPQPGVRSWSFRWTSIEVGATSLLIGAIALSAYMPIRMQFSGLVIPSVMAVVGSYSLERGLLSQLLRNRLLVYFGELSFGLYMLHFGVITVASRAGLSIASHPVIYGALLFAVAMIGSAIAYHFIERPARSRMRKTGNRLVDRLDNSDERYGPDGDDADESSERQSPAA